MGIHPAGHIPDSFTHLDAMTDQLMPDVLIRHYQASDQPAVFQIAADTAFFGEPVEAFMEGRNLFCDAFVLYYTTQEAMYGWVAFGSNGVMGYLLGCADTPQRARKWVRHILFPLIGGLIGGHYQIGRRTLSYAFGTLVGYVRGEVPGVNLVEYPAHLHINVQEGSRGSGVGGRLLEAYLEQLRLQGVRGVHLETTNLNQAASHLYEKLGFRLLGVHSNRYWSKRLGLRVENRRYGLRLG
jgi:ribosomal protein S18 acetylase RimI-like enzyme